MRLLLLSICGLAILAFIVLRTWTGPDREAISISSQFTVGGRSTNLLYMVATRGFEVVRFANGQMEYVRGDKRGQQGTGYERFYYPYGNQIEDVCQGKKCVFYGAKRIDRPFGRNSKLRHIYKVGWVERDNILQAVGKHNRIYSYPLK